MKLNSADNETLTLARLLAIYCGIFKVNYLEIQPHEGSRYQLELKGQIQLPVGRTRVKALRA